MANKRDLKKDINFVLGDIIEAVYIWEESNPEAKKDKGEKIIDEAIAAFDELMVKVNDRKIEDPKKHFKSIREDLEKKANELVDQVNTL